MTAPNPGKGVVAGGDVGRGWFPLDAERHRREGEPVCVVQARPVTVTTAEATPTDWNPAAMAARYVFGR